MATTSFVQYERCDICRLNHRKKRSHVYSKHHQGILKSILQKFLKKINDAKKMLESPEVESGDWEDGVKNWCYCCGMEVTKHVKKLGVTLCYAGLLHHLMSDSHHEATKNFWRKHHADWKVVDKFVLDKDSLTKFDELCDSAIKTREMAATQHRRSEAAKLLRQDQMRHRLVLAQKRHTMSQQPPAASHSLHMGAPQGCQGYSMMRTVAAKAAGLTVITPKAYDSRIGNIHAGSLPPWLNSSDDNTSGPPAVIGPTEQDLKKHVEMERKRKLPPERVGAKFDHTAETAASWLPSFGRVWSNNRRTHGRDQFMKELRKRPHSSHTAFQPRHPSATYVPKSDSLSTSSDVYQPKRKANECKDQNFENPDHGQSTSWTVNTSSFSHPTNPQHWALQNGPSQYNNNNHWTTSQTGRQAYNTASGENVCHVSPYADGYHQREVPGSSHQGVQRIAISDSLLMGSSSTQLAKNKNVFQ